MSLIGDTLKLTNAPQRILLGGLGIALVAASTLNGVQMFENRALANKIAKLDGTINDPRNGYVVRLTQATANTETCKAAIGRQSTAIRAQSRRDAATVAGVQVRYDIEHAARVRAEKSAAVFMAQPPRGTTLAERVSDVDAQILGDLK